MTEIHTRRVTGVALARRLIGTAEIKKLFLRRQSLSTYRSHYTLTLYLLRIESSLKSYLWKVRLQDLSRRKSFGDQSSSLDKAELKELVELVGS